MKCLHPWSKSSIIDPANASATEPLMRSFEKLGVVHLESESTDPIDALIAFNTLHMF